MSQQQQDYSFRHLVFRPPSSLINNMPDNVVVVTARRLKCLLGADLCCAVLVLLNVFVLPALIAKGLVLKEGSPTYAAYIEPPLATRFNIYFFNITNLEEYDKAHFDQFYPKFKEIGPFKLLLKRRRENIAFGAAGTLTSQVNDTIVADEDNPVLQPGTLISTAMLKSMISFGINSSTRVYGQLNVSELLFDPKYGFLKDFARLQKPTTIYTGEDSAHPIYSLRDVEGKTHSSFKDGCNKIVGTFEGVGFPPQTHRLRLYMDPFQRSFKLKFSGYSFGATRFDFDPKSFSMKSVKQNRCYVFNEDVELYDGMMMMAPLMDQMNANPIYVSFPHMLYGSKELIASVDGMHPKAKLHKSYYHIETASGLPTKVRMRFQVNWVLNGRILPLIWQEAAVDLDFKMSAQLKLVHFMVYYMPVLECLSVVLLSLALFHAHRSWKRKYTVESVMFKGS